MMNEVDKQSPQAHVFSDASGSWGCAAFHGTSWFQLPWPSNLPLGHISAKEMVPVLAAAAIWGHKWLGMSVRFHCDNSAVVALLNSGSVKDNDLMHLMRCLVFIAARFDFVFTAAHIRGRDNVLADALSRNKSPLFLSLFPQALRTPTPLPQALQDLLIGSRPAGLDLANLDKSVEFFFRNSLASSTQRSYASAQSRYLTFCSEHSLLPLPVGEPTLCRFASFLALQNISHATIKCYLSAIRRLQIAENLPDPHIASFARLESVIRGIKMQQAKQGDQHPKRLPITIDMLSKLRGYFEARAEDRDSFMLWAAISCCFFGFMRAGELTLPSEAAFDPASHLSMSDVSIDDAASPSVVKLQLKASKTDPFRRGVEIVLGRTHNALCPVTALLAYLAKRGNGPGFLFLFRDGRPLTKSRFVARVRQALALLGIDSSKYAGHSFRIGAATAAGAAGLSDSIIQMLGRWKSSAYQLYIRTPRDTLANFAAVISSEAP